MRITCSQPDLSRALAIVGRAVATRPTMPALSCVHLRAADGQLDLRATDLDLAIETRCPANVEQDGTLLLPHKRLAELLASPPPGATNVTLAADGHHCKLVLGGRRATVNGQDPEDFPPTPALDGAVTFSVGGGALAHALGRTLFSVAKDEVRPTLCGLLWQVTDDRLTLAAADGYCLAVDAVTLIEGAGPGMAVIPASSLQELVKVIGKDDAVLVTLGPTQATFATESVTLTTRLLEGAFPNFQQIIPTSHTTAFTITTALLANAVRAAQTFGRENSDIVRFAAEGDAVTLSAQSSDLGEIVEAVPAEVEGMAAQVALNGAYLLELLGTIGAERVRVELTSPARPVVVRPTGSEDGYVYVQMPMSTTKK